MSISLPNHRAADRYVGRWKAVLSVGLFLGVFLLLNPAERLPASEGSGFLAVDFVGSGPLAKSEVSTVSYRNSLAEGDERSDRLFGMDAEPVSGGELLNKWHRAEAGIAKDLEVVAQCRISESCSPPAQKLIELSQEGAGRSGRARAGLINRAVDLAIRPVSDETQWGVPDRWSNPLETLLSGRGDCEDYAIVKYAALLEAGFRKDSLKIVVLKNRFPAEDHAVVAVRIDDQWLILDNRTLALVRDTDIGRAIPEFVLDDHGVKRFVLGSRLSS